MYIIKRVAGADTYFTGKDRSPWSSEMKHARVYDELEEVETALEGIDYPLGDIVVEELPDTGRYTNKTARGYA